MFIPRTITEHIRYGATQMPVVAVIGPRQSGKSTLIQQIFNQHTYLDMQDAEMVEFANSDPKGFLAHFKNDYGLIIDEAQYAPSLFSQIKVEADKNPRAGYYILSGSQNFLLHEKISESLAGRVYFYTLLPLSIAELQNAQLLSSKPEEQIMRGFYPRVYQSSLDPHQYYENYFATYVERDIRSIRNIDNILPFKKFMQLCALRIGTTLNVAEIAMQCGVSAITAKQWLSLLQTSFVLFMLPSYHNNLGKRTIKSPKLYFYDVGLAITLIGAQKETIVSQRSLYGALFENMIIADVLKESFNLNQRVNATFYRDSNQREIDLILEKQGITTPIEIKSSTTIQPSFFDNVRWFNEQLENHQNPIVVYGGTQTSERNNGSVVAWNNLQKLFR